jgi:electron transport complex protein RnfC
MSTGRAIVTAPLPRQVQLPLGKLPDREAVAIVTPGERVLTGQAVAQTDAEEPTRLCASISGTVSAIRSCAIPGRAQHLVSCIVIDGDGLDEIHPDCKPIPNPRSMDSASLCTAIARAGVVGLGGALFPTADKLSGETPVDLLILNGAECEPYITCDDMLMRERAGRVIDGARIMLAALGCEQAVIAVESDMPEARAALRAALDELMLTNVGLAEVTAKYPAGGERQLIELLTGREVPAGGLPRDIGIVCQNVATAAAVSDLCRNGTPLISRIVTVTGSGVAEPVNVEVRLGAPLRDTIAAAGGYAPGEHRLLMGGPMMGATLPGDQMPVTEATNCLLVGSADEYRAPEAEFPCIRCGECSRVCPARLLPQELLPACEADLPERLELLRLDACIECGCCDYVCPSRIALTPRFVVAKQRLQDRHEARRQARLARQRSEARDERRATAQAQFADGPAAEGADKALAELKARLDWRNGD